MLGILMIFPQNMALSEKRGRQAKAKEDKIEVRNFSGQETENTQKSFK